MMHDPSCTCMICLEESALESICCECGATYPEPCCCEWPAESIPLLDEEEETSTMTTETMVIPERGGLDTITVYWTNYAPGQGMATIVCWGSAWNCYFGGMSGRTIQQFFSEVGSDYLLPKLGITPHLKQTKRDSVYLKRIIEAVQSALKEQAVAA